MLTMTFTNEEVELIEKALTSAFQISGKNEYENLRNAIVWHEYVVKSEYENIIMGVKI